MDKLRIKGENELAQQGKALAAVRDVLSAHGIRPLVTGGTLLGIMREGDFIPWDWDAEMFVRYSEVSAKGVALVEDFRAAGMAVSSPDFDPESWKIEATRDGFSIEIRAWQEEQGFLKRKEFRFPAGFVAQTRTVKLRGEEYEAPADYDGYLTFVYGDWRTPRRTADKKEYLSASFYGGKRSLARRIWSRLRRWIYRWR